MRFVGTRHALSLLVPTLLIFFRNKKFDLILKTKLTIRKIVFIVLGTISLVMSYVGVALPGVPGIPFILLTAYFYVRSSDRLYKWLINSRILGRILREFHAQKTVPLGFKIFVVSQLWVSIVVAQIWFIEQLWIRILVFASGIFFSVLIFLLKKNDNL